MIIAKQKKPRLEVGVPGPEALPQAGHSHQGARAHADVRTAGKSGGGLAEGLSVPFTRELVRSATECRTSTLETADLVRVTNAEWLATKDTIE